MGEGSEERKNQLHRTEGLVESPYQYETFNLEGDMEKLTNSMKYKSTCKTNQVTGSGSMESEESGESHED